MFGVPALAQSQVGAGAVIYGAANGHVLSFDPGSCASCHFANLPADTTQTTGNGSNHLLAANNLQRVLKAFTGDIAPSGVMTRYLGTTALNASDPAVRDRAFKLALYIGQYLAPVYKTAADAVCTNPSLAMAARSGAESVQDIYPCLADGGSTGFLATGGAARDLDGVFIANAVNAQSVGADQVAGTATVAYNVRYTSVAGFTGSASFEALVRNPAATAGVGKTVNVTVYGITSATTALVVARGQSYGTLYDINSNDTLATFGATLSTGAALSTIGLSVDPGTGVISGTVTGAPGAYTLRVSANISGATVGAGNAGTVTRDIALTIGGITSAASVIYTQDQAISAYQITSNLPVTANTYTINSVLPGLAFSTSSGQLTGTPTQAGTTDVTIGATTSAGLVSQNLQVVVNSAGPPVLTSNLPVAPAVAGTRDAVVNPAYTLSANRPPLSNFVVVSGALPPGLLLNPTSGAITGTPSASGDFPVGLRTSNASGDSNTLNLTWRINPVSVPVISGASTVSTNVNTVFAGYQIAATNAPILSYEVFAPSVLPTGLTLDVNGQIAGTPTQSGVVTTQFRATNAAGTSNVLSVEFTIVPTSLPGITVPLMASPLVTGVVDTAISAIPITLTNEPILTLSATGLPNGLSINGARQIVGTPTQSGDFSVVVTASNAFGPNSTAAVTIRISPRTAPTISGQSSVTVTVDSPLPTYQIVASNPVVTSYAVVLPSVLPPGLALNTTTGAISGTPSASGNYATMLSASNAAGASGPFTLSFTVDPRFVPVVSAPLQAAPVVTGTANQPITAIQIAASNPAILSYGATGLPAGLTVNASGQIVGTPTQSGDFPVTVSARNIIGTGSSATPVTIRINPDMVPAINSANTVALTANSAMTPYQITAQFGPITSYAVVAPSVLPTGLSLNTASGVISGTTATSGTFTTMVSATNVFGVSAPFTINWAVEPSAVPGVSVPAIPAMSAGVAITPIQIAATNLPILEYLASNLPPGLAVNATSGAISGTPTTPGNYSAVLSARNVRGTGNLTVPFAISVPAPSACAMSVALNTATTLDLATCLFTGFAPTGVTIVTAPAHGSAVASGTRVTYTPVNNYFGADSFTFEGTGAGGTSPRGTVTVTVTGRPDPVQDAVVREMVIAQSETAQRFSRAQLSNFQRRMESLHRSAGATAQSGTALQASPGAPSGGGFGAAALAASPGALPSSLTSGLQASPGALIGPQTPGAITALAANRAPTAARESEVLAALASGLGVKALPFAEGLMSLARNRSVNLAGVASGMGINGAGANSGGTNYWIEGVATFGTRDASGNFSGSEFSSNGITVGVDRRYSDQLALGMGLGYARDKTEIGTDGSVNRARGYSLAVYGSYRLSPASFVDALLGVGSLDFDTTRFVAPMNDFALGKRRGTQLFGSLTGGYEFRDKNLLVSPYGRIDFSIDRLNSSTETGAGAFALTYFGQTSTSVQASLGVRAESVHATGFGYAVPRLRAEYRHELKRSGLSYVGYADQVGGTRYALAPAGSPRGAMVLRLGSDFILRDGLTLAFEYQLSHSFSNASTHALRFRLSKDFDARGLPRQLSQDPEAAHDEPENIQLETGIVHDDNVTRAKTGPNRLSDYSYTLNASKTFVQPLTDFSRVLLTATVGGEKFRRFNGLSRVHGGGEAEVQYRASSEFDEPTFGAFARFSAEAFESSLRDGYRLSAGVSVRQALTDRINVFAALSHNLRNASSKVFSTRENSVRANLDYALSDNAILYVGADFRRGDIVSTGWPSLENATVADVFAQDDAYPGGRLFSYRFRGNTLLWTMGYNLGLGPRDSIDFSWRHIRSTPGLRPSFVTTPKSYKANQLSAVYLMRF